MTGTGISTGKRICRAQADAELNQAAPVQNTWYTILEQSNCRLYRVAVNIEDTNETLEVRFTVDDQTTTPVGVACNHSTTYHVYISADAINRNILTNLDTSAANIRFAFLIEGKNVKVEVRKTTAAGAGNLTGVALYGIY